MTAVYAELTPYQFASNKPINSIDLDGLEARTSTKGEFVNGYWTMGSDNHISLKHEAEFRMQAEQAMKNKPFVPDYGTIRNNDITSTPQYKFQKEMINTYGDYVLPLDVSKRLIRGEEVPAWELGVEAAGFIPFGKAFGKGGKALIEGAIKVWKNGDEVLEAAYKFGKLGHKGTKSYNEAIDAVKKGGNFVASSKEEALEILNATFKNIPDETGKATSKFGYRIDEAVEAAKDGLKQGHQGTHINYYDKANSVKGTIVIE